MTITQNNPFPEVDFANYRNFEQLKLPNGEVLYIVPGHPGYVVNPVASNASGKIVIRPNPKDAINDEKQAKEFQEKQQKQAEYNNSPVGQAVPVVLGTGGTIAGIYAMKDGAKATGQVVNGQMAMTDGTFKPVPGGTTPAATNPAQIAAGAPPANGAPATTTPPANGVATPNVVSAQAVQPVGSVTMPDGSPGVLMSDGAKVGTNGSYVAKDGTATTAAASPYAGYMQMGVGAVQAYQAYNSYQQGDYLGAGVYGAAGASAIAAGGTAAGTWGATSLGAYASPLAVAAGAYGLYENSNYVADAPAGGRRNTTSTAQGAAAGAAIGTYFAPGPGTLIGAGVGALYGLGMSYFGSSKDEHQMIRDEVRSYMKKNGIINEEYQGTLADGSTFDYGKDGKGLAPIDFNDPVSGEAISLGNVIAAGEGLTGAALEATARLYANAILSNANGNLDIVKANARKLMADRKFDAGAVQGQLEANKEQFRPGEYDVYSVKNKEIFGTPSGFQVAAAAPPAKAPLPPSPANAPITALPPGQAATVPQPGTPAVSGTNVPFPNSTPKPKLDPILPNGKPRDANDPNQYWLNDKGEMEGTYIGFKPAGVPMVPVNPKQVTPAQVAAAAPPRMNPNSPGFRNGVRIDYGSARR